MRSKEKIIRILRDVKDDLKKYKVKTIGAFGSVARGEHTAKSDVDVLVDFEHGADLLDLVGLGFFLERKLGSKVDVISKKALRKEIKKAVLHDVIPV